MGTITRARNFQCKGHVQILAGADEGRHVAALARLVFPTHGIDVAAAPEQAAKQRDLFIRGQCSADKLLGFGLAPGDAMGFEQFDQPRVFDAQAGKLIVPARRHPDHKPAAVKRRSRAPRFAWGTRKRRRARSNSFGVDVSV